MKSTHPIWDIAKLAVVCGICVSPFWFLANNINDGDELVKTGVSVALVTITTVVMKHVNAGGKPDPTDT